jgi:hypothetical protein
MQTRTSRHRDDRKERRNYERRSRESAPKQAVVRVHPAVPSNILNQLHLFGKRPCFILDHLNGEAHQLFSTMFAVSRDGPFRSRGSQVQILPLPTKQNKDLAVVCRPSTRSRMIAPTSSRIIQGFVERWRDLRSWLLQNVGVSFWSDGDETSSGCFQVAANAKTKREAMPSSGNKGRIAETETRAFDAMETD